MNQIVTIGIVLARTDYGEADRIVTLLTPDHGKVRVMAKGVRRVKSKLAGGIELFSISQITFIPGRSEIKTLVSARLQIHYGNIVKNIERTMLGYDFIKRINKITEDAADSDYFDLLKQAIASLDKQSIDLEVIAFWFDVQLLRLSGHDPNTISDVNDKALSVGVDYAFDFDSMAFKTDVDGQFSANHIKLLRLTIRAQTPAVIANVQGAESIITTLSPLVKTMTKHSLV